MKRIQFFFFVALLATQHITQGQGTLTITFDDPPYTALIPHYSESGMYFWNDTGGNNGFGHGGLAQLPGFPNNGTLYLQGAGHSGYNSFGANFTNGSTFGVESIDLAAFGGDSTNISAIFRGWLSNGTLLTESVTGTGIDFRTIDFGPEWSSGLLSFGVANANDSPDGWSVDNLVVIVPEPGTGALMVVGVLAALVFRRRKPRERST